MIIVELRESNGSYRQDSHEFSCLVPAAIVLFSYIYYCFTYIVDV